MARVKSIPIKSAEQRRSKGLKTLKALKHPAATHSVTDDKKKHKKPRKYHPGTVALRDIRREQKSTNAIIPQARVGRIARKLSDSIRPGTRFKRAALEALHVGLEAALIEMFGDSQIFALHARRVTVSKRDVDLVRFLNSKKSSVQASRPASD